MDITLCVNEECEVKENCLRYLLLDKANDYQSYADFQCNKDNNWEYKLR